MSNQILISSGAKLRDLDDVIIGTDGVLSSLGFNVANGVPKLDENGKILVSQLPNSVMEFKGVWNAATNTPTLADGVGNAGDVYLCNVAGTVNFGAGPITFAVGDYAVYTGTVWARSSGATGTVTSVGLSKDGDALAITGSPITTSGTINIGFTGTNLQYINGAGNLTTFPILTGFVPYTGATQNVNLGTYGLLGDFLQLNTSPTSVPTAVGTVSWDNFYRTMQIVTGDGDTTLQVGQEQVTLIHNNTGSTLTDGQVVYVTGSTGELPTVALASNTTEATSSVTFGVVTESIANGADGFITTSGMVHGLNTLAFNEGDALYLGATAGTFTNVKPTAPNNLVLVGYMIKKAGGNGSIFVKIQNGYELEELHDVLITSVADGDILQWNSATSLWENVAGSTTNIAEGTNQYFTNARARAAISLTTTGSTGAATYDNSTGVLNIPNYVDQYVGTVTSVGLSAPTGFSVSGSPVTSSGTLALSFASGYSLPTNVKQSNWDDAYTWVAAFPTQTGNAGKFLTTDGSTLSWATVIAGVQSVTASSPLFSSGGANPNITIQVANTSQNGYLSSTDWNTFNGKQNALTNPVTGTGTNNTLPKFTATGSTIGDSLFTDNGTNGAFGGANYSSGTGVRTFNITAPQFAGVAFWTSSGYTADIFSYEVSGNLLIGADPTNILTNSNLIFAVDGTTIATLNTTNVTLTKALIATSATFSSSVGINGGDFRYRPNGDVTNSPALVFKDAGNSALDICAEVIGVANADSRPIAFRVSNVDLGRFEAMRISSNGFVGIGAQSPSSLLNIDTNNATLYDPSIDDGQAAFGSTITIRNANTTTNSFSQLNMQVSGDSGRALGRIVTIRTASATSDMAFITENDNTKAEKLRIKSNGNILINTTTDAGYKLDVNGTSRFSGYITASAGINSNYARINGRLFVTNEADYGDMVSTSGMVSIGYYPAGQEATIRSRNYTTSTNTALVIDSSTFKVSALSGTGTRIVGTDSGGGLNSITIGSGLSLSGSTLSATGGSAGTVTGSGSNSQVSFWTSSSNISGTSNFVWDNSNARLGIGTTSPQSRLNTFLSADLASIQIRAETDTSAVVSYTGLGASVLEYYRNAATGVDFTIQTKISAAGGGGNIVFSPNSNSADLTPVERMRLLKTGQLLINGTSETGGAGTLELTQLSGKGGLVVNTVTTTPATIYLRNVSSTPYNVLQSNVALSISSSQILLNTTTNNGYLLQLNGSASFAYGYLSVFRGSSSPNDILVGNDGSRFYIGGNTYVAGSVTATGGFFDTSDARLKTLVEDNYLLSSIANVKAKLYTKGGRKELGYYAQDLLEILPSAVNEGSDGFLSLSYAQVHTAKIAVIEDEVTMLKNRVSELEKQLNIN